MASSTVTASPDLPIQWRDSTPHTTFLASCWSHTHNHHRATETRIPRAVVHATSTRHAVEVVRLAVAQDCRVSVRSGGHSWAGWSVRDDAILLDLGALKDGKFDRSDTSTSHVTTTTSTTANPSTGKDAGLAYDPATSILAAPPSATGRAVNEFLADHGRMFAGGHCPDVGLGGFLLQGGMGWNCKNWGWACEALVGLDVVTAKGEEVYASESENEDLFWAARGAGPGFPAIVTRFHLKTRPIQQMFQSIYFWPISEYRKVLQWVIDVRSQPCSASSLLHFHLSISPAKQVSPTADPDTEIVCLGQHIPQYTTPVIFANFLTFKPDRAQGEAALRPLDDDPARPPNALPETFFAASTSLRGQYTPQEAANPPGHRYCSDNAYISNDEVDVPAVLERAFTTLPNRLSFALYFSMNPTSRRSHYKGKDGESANMALSMQSDHYFALYTIWKEAEEDERIQGWTASVMSEVERHAVGSYLGDADFQVRQTRFWGEAEGKRLMEVRRKWDPEGRICGFLDVGDKSGVEGLKNEFEWK
ncbi:hypothetical protein BD289DRAFT_193217 [Coniella lustricola]|uniref:FAD-binding PCMH-type domain-containing protein n=1 Tax=Coniella lustricola TaxID=2025994 RepID=A0A2T3AM65_9PEZI|nr:hypothetical protein BD289DRAFT_193217 [Coniella lustricola]